MLSNILTRNPDIPLNYLDGVGEYISRQNLYSLLECCREQGALSITSYVITDGSNLGFEPHIKHSVCLVQN